MTPISFRRKKRAFLCCLRVPILAEQIIQTVGYRERIIEHTLRKFANLSIGQSTSQTGAMCWAKHEPASITVERMSS